MPNFVLIGCSITGPSDELTRLRELVIHDDQQGEPLFDFSRIIPVEEDTDQWRSTHWGTKWNAHDTDVSVEADELVVSFYTAWEFPFAVSQAGDNVSCAAVRCDCGGAGGVLAWSGVF
jgi:hypothetical protein